MPTYKSVKDSYKCYTFRTVTISKYTAFVTKNKVKPLLMRNVTRNAVSQKMGLKIIPVFENRLHGVVLDSDICDGP